MKTRLFFFCTVAVLLFFGAYPTTWAAGIAYNVTSTGDGDNVGTNTNPVDSNGQCTLRAAIQAANSHAGDDAILFNIPTTDPGYNSQTGTWAINLPRQLPDLTSNIAINGPGASKLIVQRNTATQFRIFNLPNSTVVSFSDLTIAGGLAPNNGNGGAIQNAGGGLLKMTNVIVTNNTASFGGGIYNGNIGIFIITGCTIQGNSATNNGGGLVHDGSSFNSITNSILRDNTAAANGGAVYVNTGTIDITNCTLLNNKSNSTLAENTGGGAIYNAGFVTIVSSDLSLNGVLGDTAHKLGGAIWNISGAGVTIRSSAIHDNFVTGGAFAHGGAIYNVGLITVTNSTFSGNSASSSVHHGDAVDDGQGGAIQNESGATLRISNSTITNNHFYATGTTPAGTSGGVDNLGSCTVKSTIIAENTAASGLDVGGVFHSAGFNLIGSVISPATGFTAATDQTATDPKLDPAGLKDNGGPTRTIALVFGSPAIDKGIADSLDEGTLSFDQRGTGFARKFDDTGVANAAGDGTDVGAFELQTAAPIPATLANVSTRLRVETSDNVLFGGFIVTGTQPKKVIVRALGPSVQAPGILANPTLELYQGNTLLETNDNWVDSPNKQAIIDSTIPPPDNLESAIVRSLPANATTYTAIVRGVNNGTGIGVIEVYDLDGSVDSKLANISTRGLVQTGDNVLIAGTIVVGQAAQKVLICALGPSLPVQGNLANPTLELRDGNGTLMAANDNWVDSPDKQIIMDTGAAPTNNLESAIIQTLPANGTIYTAIVRGAINGTGVAVVEVFALN